MKDKILAALQTKFDGVDAKTLSRIATKLAKTTNEEADIQTAVDGVTIQQLMENYGDNRATEATKTAVANYEKTYGLKDGKKVEPTDPGQEPGSADPDEPAWAKSLRQEIAEQRKKLEGYQAKEIGDARKAKLAALLADAPENVRKMYEGNFANMTFQDDEHFGSWLDTNKPIIEGLVNDYKAKGASVHSPKGGNSARQPGEADPLVVARAERMAEAAKAAPSAIMGLPTPAK